MWGEGWGGWVESGTVGIAFLLTFQQYPPGLVNRRKSSDEKLWTPVFTLRFVQANDGQTMESSYCKGREHKRMGRKGGVHGGVKT